MVCVNVYALPEQRAKGERMSEMVNQSTVMRVAKKWAVQLQLPPPSFDRQPHNAQVLCHKSQLILPRTLVLRAQSLLVILTLIGGDEGNCYKHERVKSTCMIQEPQTINDSSRFETIQPPVLTLSLMYHPCHWRVKSKNPLSRDPIIFSSTHI